MLIIGAFFFRILILIWFSANLFRFNSINSWNFSSVTWLFGRFTAKHFIRSSWTQKMFDRAHQELSIHLSSHSIRPRCRRKFNLLEKPTCRCEHVTWNQANGHSAAFHACRLRGCWSLAYTCRYFGSMRNARDSPIAVSSRAVIFAFSSNYRKPRGGHFSNLWKFSCCSTVSTRTCQ